MIITIIIKIASLIGKSHYSVTIPLCWKINSITGKIHSITGKIHSITGKIHIITGKINSITE